MELTKLSGYDQYILMTEQARGVGANMQAYQSFKECLAFLEKCAKSDSKVINYNDEIIEKPINRSQAQKTLDNIARIKWDNTIVSVARFMNLELR